MNISDERKQIIKKEVLSIFDTENFTKFPIPIKAIVKSFSCCRLITYSKMAATLGMDINQFIAYAGTDDAYTDYNVKTGQYLIVYNDTNPFIMSSNRYRWNIAHELGHIILGHHREHNCRTFRDTLQTDKYYELETEADYFAKLLLVPFAPLGFEGTLDIESMKNICRISPQMANNLDIESSRWAHNGRGRNKYDIQLLNRFYPYKLCLNCHTVISTKGVPHYCHICGSSEFDYYSYRPMNSVKYQSIELNKYHKPLSCPACGYHDMDNDGRFCENCGVYVANTCSDINCPGYDGLAGDARYCHICGQTSTFAINDFLKYHYQGDRKIIYYRDVYRSIRSGNYDEKDFDDYDF